MDIFQDETGRFKEDKGQIKDKDKDKIKEILLHWMWIIDRLYQSWGAIFHQHVEK